LIIYNLFRVEPEPRIGSKKSLKLQDLSKLWPGELRVPVVALAQLSRAVETASERRPLLSTSQGKWRD